MTSVDPVSTGDIDPAAIALARRLGGVASVRLPGFGNREFDVVSDRYIAQTTGASSASARWRNFLNLSKRVQIRETLRAAKETGRDALFEFRAGEPAPRVRAFIERNARRLGVQVRIEIGYDDE